MLQVLKFWIAASLLLLGLDLAWSVHAGYRFRIDGPLLVAIELATISGLTASVSLVAFLIAKRLRPAAFLETPAESRGRVWMLAMGVGLGLAAFATSAPVPGNEQLQPPRPRDESRPAPSGESVILVVLDTLRADHLGAYGYERDTTPWLDGFATRGRLYEEARSSSSFTLPAHASLFTGLLPQSHGARVLDSEEGLRLSELGRLDDVAPVAPLSSEAVTLAERFAEAGYETGAICANTAYLYRDFGLDQGFASYVDSVPVVVSARPFGLQLALRLLGERSWRLESLLESNERYYLLAEEVNELAIAWAEERHDRPFFLFLNYMDAHAPYRPLPGYRGLFPHSNAYDDYDKAAITSGERPIHELERANLVDRYDAEIRYLDDQLARLSRRLAQLGIWQDATVVFVGDHGESFGEHHRLGHAVSLYESEIHVPLLMKGAGIEPGTRVAEPVQITDLAPTLLARAGLAVPENLDGRVLRESGSAGTHLTTLGRYQREESEQAFYDGSWKLIRSSSGKLELYDLAADPEERADLSATDPGRTERMRLALDAREAGLSARFQPESTEGSAVDGELRDRLRALGYAE